MTGSATRRWHGAQPAASILALLGVLGVLALAACTPAGGSDGAHGSAGGSPAGADDGVPRTAVPVTPSSAAATAPATAGAATAVGPLFPDGLGRPHGCTAAVVDSLGGDVVMTAAHCVSGQGGGVVFVPGYHQGRAPFGVFPVTGAYAPTGWLTDQDTDDDVAFLTVAPDGHRTVQQSAGAVTLRAGAVHDGQQVTLTAYDDGMDDDSPVQCTTTVRDSADDPTVDCHGFVAGSSGTPWLAQQGSTVVAVGLIGGLHQGGCEEYTSYSSSLGADAVAALTAAEQGAASETLPSPPDDGC